MNTDIYTFNFDQGKYWITLKEGDISSDNNKYHNQKNVSHISDTGQFISNCFFFLEGIESEIVINMINDIFKTIENKENISSINHLQNQDFIASFLFKYIIQNNSSDYNLITSCLEYLYNISEFLANKLNLKIDLNPTKKNKGDTNSISRCSYKFCNYTYFCQFNYPEKNISSNKGCYSDHYVYNKVAQDIYFLLNYIKNNFNSESAILIRNNQEVIKCINTIAYVIKHLYDELWNIYVSCNKKDTYEKLHRNIHK